MEDYTLNSKEKRDLLVIAISVCILISVIILNNKLIALILISAVVIAIISFYKMNGFLTLGLIIIIFLIRPSELGENYSIIGIAMSIILAVFFLVSNKDAFKLKKQNLWLVISSVVFWSYCGIQAAILQSFHLDFALKAIVSNIIIIVIFSIILNNDIINKYFFRCLILILVFFTISYYITFILSLFLGYERLYLFHIVIPGYENGGVIYFPFTISYDFTSVLGVVLIRMLSGFREVGIAQIFYIFALFISHKYFEKNKTINFILVLGIIACFSTTGFINLIITYFLYIILVKSKNNKKMTIIGITLIAIMIIAFINIPGISIQDKAQTSITDRQYATLYGLELFKEHLLFGIGYYNNDVSLQNTGINFISSSYTIGLVGCILYFLVFLSTLISAKNIKNYLICITPLIITLLFSEPLIDAPLIYVLLLADF